MKWRQPSNQKLMGSWILRILWSLMRLCTKIFSYITNGAHLVWISTKMAHNYHSFYPFGSLVQLLSNYPIDKKSYDIISFPLSALTDKQTTTFSVHYLPQNLRGKQWQRIFSKKRIRKRCSRNPSCSSICLLTNSSWTVVFYELHFLFLISTYSCFSIYLPRSVVLLSIWTIVWWFSH